MRLSPSGLALIKRFEGFSPEPYRCPAGYWTIGYGHLLSAPSAHLSLTKMQAEALLRQDLAQSEGAVRRLVPVPLTQGQFDALVSFAFNLGAGALQRSGLRQKVLRGEHEAAAREFHRWVYAGGRKLPGLVRRREAEARRYGEMECGTGFPPFRHPPDLLANPRGIQK